MRFLAFPLILILFVTDGFSQAVGDWQAYPSHSRIRFIVETESQFWAASDGGLFEFDEEGEILSSLTPLDGMYESAVTSLISDQPEKCLWLGYPDGTVQKFDLQTRLFSTVGDIRRASQFTQRSINDFEMNGSELLIATGFGIVKLDKDRLLVLDTFFNLGTVTSSSPVTDISLRNDSLYAATNSGIAVGSLNDELIVPQSWRNISTPDETAVESLDWFSDTLFVVTSGNLWKFSDEWNQVILPKQFEQDILEVESQGDLLIATGTDRFFAYDTQELRFVIGVNGPPPTKALNSGDNIWIGSTEQGISRYSKPSIQTNLDVLPDGPALNAFSAITAKNGVMVVASSNSPGGSRGFGITGYYILRDNSWKTFDIRNSEMVASQSFNSVFSASMGTDKVLLGSWGFGFGIHDLTNNELSVFNSNNSPLTGIANSESFIVLTSAHEDNTGAIWMTSFLSEDEPLFRFNPSNDDWISFDFPASVPFNANYLKVIVDSFNQPWVIVSTASREGTGIMVMNPGNISDPSDDESVYLTGVNANLPNNDVNDIVEDKKGEVWIATSRGVARFLFPELIVLGGLQERQAQWLITENENGDRVFFLRDINATSLAVNASNQKWIGSEGNGAWLVTESGDQALLHFTTENSPLISDNVLDITVDDATGTVYFATDKGLVSYTGVSKQDSPKLSSLFVYPNPYSYSQESGPLYIDGLIGEAVISIVSASGTLIDRITASGGRTEWIPKRADGKSLPTGVYILSAYDEGENRAFGKVIVTP